MLHSCAARGCKTLTLSTYCVEHELVLRLERQQARDRNAAMAPEPRGAKMGSSPDSRREEPAAT